MDKYKRNVYINYNFWRQNEYGEEICNVHLTAASMQPFMNLRLCWIYSVCGLQQSYSIWTQDTVHHSHHICTYLLLLLIMMTIGDGDGDGGGLVVVFWRFAVVVFFF